MSKQKYWVWLAECSGLSAANAGKLLEHFGSAEAVYKAKGNEYMEISGFRLKNVKGLLDKNLEKADEILLSCAEIGCEVITQDGTSYPQRLKNIYDPPVVLYVKGKLPRIDEMPVFGIVGTRICTPYGITHATRAGQQLSECGFVVVTGLAKGIDTAATLGALRGGTPTIGVVGCGVDFVYPPENTQIYRDVENFGAIVSEYPPGTEPHKTRFPMRNRIISGLSVGIAVVEAPMRSGALITAARALEQGRDVFVLPGNVDADKCEGSNRLIREGATPFLSPENIIDEYIGLFEDKLTLKSPSADKKAKGNAPKTDYVELGKLLRELSGDEKEVAETLAKEPLLTDEIIIATGLPAQSVLTALTMLELSGFTVRGVSGKYSLLG
ncbi:MAG: DNA-processing protein DprA [Oscillospiraceae bacterium]|nr:DNA-processing protein DprA [Oscillospiraceae bacterium]MCL2278620.1 DNA-processing protein DprA [Oscillospiraceae bacterium]